MPSRIHWFWNGIDWWPNSGVIILATQLYGGWNELSLSFELCVSHQKDDSTERLPDDQMLVGWHT